MSEFSWWVYETIDGNSAGDVTTHFDVADEAVCEVDLTTPSGVWTAGVITVETSTTGFDWDALTTISALATGKHRFDVSTASYLRLRVSTANGAALTFGVQAVASAESGGAYFLTVDPGAIGNVGDELIDVADYQTLRVRADAAGGATAWSSATIDLQWSTDGVHWTAFSPAKQLSAEGDLVELDVRDVRLVRVYVSVAQIAGPTINVVGWADATPLDTAQSASLLGYTPDQSADYYVAPTDVKAALDELASRIGPHLPPWRSGEWYTPDWNYGDDGTTNATPNSGWEYYFFVLVPHRVTLANWQCYVSTAEASKNLKASLYRLDAGPFSVASKIFDTGAVSIASTGFQTVAVTPELTAGVYLHGFITDGWSSGQLRRKLDSGESVRGLMGTPNSYLYYTSGSYASGMPASPVFGGAAQNRVFDFQLQPA